MSQMVVCVKADLAGTKPYGRCALMHGCAKMFRDASSAFATTGDSAVTYSKHCAVGSARAREA